MSDEIKEETLGVALRREQWPNLHVNPTFRTAHAYNYNNSEKIIITLQSIKENNSNKCLSICVIQLHIIALIKIV